MKFEGETLIGIFAPEKTGDCLGAMVLFDGSGVDRRVAIKRALLVQTLL